MSVLIVGDSLGVGLAQHLSALSAVKSGVSTAEWAGPASNAIASYNPDVVVVVLGTNDLYGAKNRPPAETGRAAAQIVAAAAGRVLLWVLPPRQPALQDHGTIAAIQAAAPNVLDARSLSIPLSGDGVHPTGQGYQILANAVLSRLNSISVAPPSQFSGAPSGSELWGDGSLSQILFFGLLAVLAINLIGD